MQSRLGEVGQGLRSSGKVSPFDGKEAAWKLEWCAKWRTFRSRSRVGQDHSTKGGSATAMACLAIFGQEPPLNCRMTSSSSAARR